MQSIVKKVFMKMKAANGNPVTTSDLLGLGSRAAVDQALSRLVRQGAIRRIRRGVYEIPRMGKLLNQPLMPSPEALVQAWARQNGLRVVPSGAYAANLLGLSTQVPAKITYYTNGRTQTLMLGSYTVRFINRGPKTMDVRGRVAPLVLQALRHLGRQGVTSETIRRLRSALTAKDKAELQSNRRCAVAWMKPVIEAIANEEGG